jgi:hypothetical protein
MKRVILMAAFAMVVGAFSGVALADETTLTGEAVDIACYLGGNAACAAKCAESGKPIGLAVGEGEEKELYLVLSDGMAAPKDVMVEHMGKTVTVTGEVTEEGGMKIVKVASVE